MRVWERAHNFWFDPDVLRQAPPVKLARFASVILKGMGFEEHAATSRLPHLRESTVDWFNEYFPEVPKKGRLRIKKAGDKSSGHEFKWRAALELRPRMIIEDDPAAIDYFRQHQSEVSKLVIVMMDQPWNRRRWDLHPYRVLGWLHVLALATVIRNKGW